MPQISTEEKIAIADKFIDTRIDWIKDFHHARYLLQQKHEELKVCVRTEGTLHKENCKDLVAEYHKLFVESRKRFL